MGELTTGCGLMGLLVLMMTVITATSDSSRAAGVLFEGNSSYRQDRKFDCRTLETSLRLELFL